MLLKLLAAKEAYLKNEEGATAIEYGLIAGAVAVVIVAGLVVMGPAIQDMFTGIGETLNENNPG